MQFFDANGSMKSLAEISEILQTRLSGFNDQAKTLILSTLAGTDGIRALSIMTREGAEGFERMGQAMNAVTADETAKTRLDTLNGSFAQLRAEVGVAADKFGESFLPVVREVAEQLTALAKGYSGLSTGTKEAVTATVIGVTTFVGLASAVSLAVVATKRLHTALTGVNGALTLMSRHPIILALTALAAVATSVYVVYKQNEEAARKFAEAQTELTRAIVDARNTLNSDTLTEYQDRAKTIEELGAKYEELARQMAQVGKGSEVSGMASFGSMLSGTAKEAAGLSKEMDAVKAKLTELGATTDNYKQRADELRDSIAENTRGVLEKNKANIDALVSMQDSINKIREAKTVYDELSHAESLNEDQTARLANAVDTLKQQVPGLNAVQAENGRLIVLNTDLIGQKIIALQAEKNQSDTTTRAELNNSAIKARAAIQSYNAEIEAIYALAQARNAIAGIDMNSDVVMTTQTARRLREIDNQIAIRKVDLSAVEDALNRIKNGTGYTGPSYGGSGGGSSYTIPDAPKKERESAAKEPTEQPWERAQRLRNEAFEAALAKEEDLFRRGIHNKSQYAEELSRLNRVFYDVMQRDNGEFVRMQTEVSRNRADFALESAEETRRRMEQRGESAQAIAKAEVSAYQSALARLSLLAEDRKRLESELNRALIELKEAAFNVSADWINRERQAMGDAGKSQLEIAQMIYDAWTRINARKSSGLYNADDIKRAADELKNAERDLRDAMESDLRRAREFDRDEALKAIEAERDALDKRIQAEEYLASLQRERTELAKLEADRAKVADDKRFELIRRDANGNLVREMVADLTRLGEIDEQLRDQRQRIADMERDEAIRRQREELDRKLEAARAYWDALLDEERIAQDVRDAVTRDGLAKTLNNVKTYLGAMVAEYKAAQAEIIAAGGLVTPTSGTVRPPATVPAPRTMVAPQSSMLDGLVGFLQSRPFTSQYEQAFRAMSAPNFGYTSPSGGIGGVNVTVPIGEINVQSTDIREIARAVGDETEERVFRKLERDLWAMKR